MTRRLQNLALIGILTLAAGCDAVGSGVPTPSVVENGDPAVPLDPDLGKPLLPPELRAGKADSLAGYAGPYTSGLSSSARVWTVARAWNDVEAEAGMAWPANSGLTWDEKYSAWLDVMQPTDSISYHDTFELVTPWGKTLPAPRLECAEAAMFLRATFASWYNLPFYLSAYSPTHSRLYFGHFGIVKVSGFWLRT
jgi:hypothetical protein